VSKKGARISLNSQGHNLNLDASIQSYSKILSLVLANAPLNDILTALVLLIESQKLGAKASVLLLSDDGKRLLSGAAPHLPQAYNDAINGVEIGPCVGSCGTAAFTGERVIVEDIANHEFWTNYKALPLEAGLHACWSEPIKDSLGEVLGTFAMYYTEIKSPTPDDLVLIEQAARLASLAIERNRGNHLQKLTHMIFNHLPMALIISNEAGSVLFANQMFNVLSELDFTDKKNQLFNYQEFFSASSKADLRALEEHLSNNQIWEGELCHQSQDDCLIYLAISVAPYRDIYGPQNCFAWLMADISDHKKANQLIQYQANNDSLTGVANRRFLLKRICDAINNDKEQKNSSLPFSLLQMDIDNFKQINDTLGHESGDLLLVAVAERLLQLLPSKGTLARLSGDEFVFMLLGQVDLTMLGNLALSIKCAFSEKFIINGQVIYTSLSTGIARYPMDSCTTESLLNCVSQAMYSAKENGRNGFQFFNQEMQLLAERTAYIHTHLKSALANNEFEIYFQPIVNTTTAAINRAEVLLRWYHKGEYISPEEFIPIAEQGGLIVAIGEWVRKEAFKTIGLLYQNGLAIDLSVNVSTLEFWSDELQQRFLHSFEQITAELELESLPYHLLTLEITESLMMQQHSNIANLLQTLRSRGIKISVDDFGTGYSSLSYLVNFPVDQIKIDKAFVEKLTVGPRHRAIVEAIVGLSRSLELSVTAEGVETKEQLDIITAYQIEMIQGYYFYRPMPKQAFLSLIHEQAGYGLI
jgi:diguanylate cyclase (GGDEF)-like protein